jgi:hypothetical protein
LTGLVSFNPPVAVPPLAAVVAVAPLAVVFAAPVGLDFLVLPQAPPASTAKAHDHC